MLVANEGNLLDKSALTIRKHRAYDSRIHRYFVVNGELREIMTNLNS